MDVHPPHHPLHTWKDFWIHLATITVGLLIAIGLEQSVEGLHRLHQRHQLEEDLRAEAVKNLKIMDGDYRYIDWEVVWAAANRDSVDSVRAGGDKVSLPFPPFRPPLGITFTEPSSSAWTTAKESELTALLPREEVKMYDRVYFELKKFDEVGALRLDAIDEELNFEGRFSPARWPIEPQFPRVSPEQLDQFSAILTKDIVANLRLRSRMDYFYSAEYAVENGSKTEEDVLKRMNARESAERAEPPAANGASH